MSRVSPELLATVPRYEGAEGSLVSVEDDQKYILLDREGQSLGEVRQAGHMWRAGSDSSTYEGEAVLEAVLRLDVAETCAMVLEKHKGYRVEDHHSVGGYRVVLHLPPRGFLIAEHVAQLLDRERELLAAELTLLDEAPAPRRSQSGSMIAEPSGRNVLLRSARGGEILIQAADADDAIRCLQQSTLLMVPVPAREVQS